MMKWFLLFCILSPTLTWSQKTVYNPNSVFSEELLLEDFEIFYNSLVAVHPSVNDFISEEDLPILYEETKNKISEGSEMELMALIEQVLVHIGCGHTVARPSSNWYKKARLYPKLLSLSVKLIDDSIFIWNQPFEDSISLRGKKITHIDGIEVAMLLKKFRNRISSDGFSKTLANHKIQKSFKTYHVFSEGFASTHQIKYLNSSGQIDSIVIPSNKPTSNIKKKDNALNQFINIHEGIGMKYYELKSDKKIALLDIDGFKRSKFKPFYKTIFKRMTDNETTDLIIDLRNNGGGYFPNGNELLTYLMQKDVYFHFSRPDTKKPKSKYLEMNFYSKLTKILFAIIPDKNKGNDRKDYQIKYKMNKKLGFKGKIYLLLNNGSYSMSGYVAAKLNTLSNSKCIGQETGGGAYGSNAILSYALTLPNTKLRVNIPYYFTDHQIAGIEKGSGTLPDYPVRYTIEDYISQKDLELDLVFSKINSQ